VVILLITSALQVIIVEFGSIAFHVAEGGLDAKYWGWSILLGSGELVVQQIINIIYYASEKYVVRRNVTRAQKNSNLITQRTDENRN
jgi:P-type Ca2+ transporter type 2B